MDREEIGTEEQRDMEMLADGITNLMGLFGDILPVELKTSVATLRLQRNIGKWLKIAKSDLGKVDIGELYEEIKGVNEVFERLIAKYGKGMQEENGRNED
jgi:hypothetical protein